MENQKVNIPEFITATILHWKYLLREEAYKQIILNALQFMVRDGRIKLYAYVVMDNHIHLVWQGIGKEHCKRLDHTFFSFTSHEILRNVRAYNPAWIKKLSVGKSDRSIQVWKRDHCPVGLYTQKFLFEKVNYIHKNPVKARMCKTAEEYPFSSAAFYKTGLDPLGILTNYREWLEDPAYKNLPHLDSRVYSPKKNPYPHLKIPIHKRKRAL